MRLSNAIHYSHTHSLVWRARLIVRTCALCAALGYADDVMIKNISTTMRKIPSCCRCRCRCLCLTACLPACGLLNAQCSSSSRTSTATPSCTPGRRVRRCARQSLVSSSSTADLRQASLRVWHVFTAAVGAWHTNRRRRRSVRLLSFNTIFTDSHGLGVAAGMLNEK